MKGVKPFKMVNKSLIGSTARIAYNCELAAAKLSQAEVSGQRSEYPPINDFFVFNLKRSVRLNGYIGESVLPLRVREWPILRGK